MKVSQVVAELEKIAPTHLAEEWDNVGLLIGDADRPVRRLMLCVDLTEAVLSEALAAKAQMVMAYHPVIFKPLSRLTASASPVAYAAARAGLAVYSMHTALDAAPGGTNDVLADMMGLVDRRPLQQQVCSRQAKVVVFTPPGDLQAVARAAFDAGAGHIGRYYDCAFFAPGTGWFCPEDGTHPAVGRPGRHEAVQELRLEIVTPQQAVPAVCRAIRQAHSYEEPAIDVVPLQLCPPKCGQGRIGRLERPVSVQQLVARIKRAAGLRQVMLAGPAGKAGRKVRTAACCAGSGGDIFRQAMGEGADFYLTGELRHHDALAAAAGGMTVACLGHSNSERPVLGPLARRMAEVLPGLDVALSGRDVDPLRLG